MNADRGAGRRTSGNDLHALLRRDLRITRVEAGLLYGPAVALVLVAVLLIGRDSATLRRTLATLRL